MGASLLFDDGTVLSFDVVISESPNFPTQITEHVVEQGTDVSDNVRVGLRQLALEVFVTNEPIAESPMFGSGSLTSFRIDTPDTQQKSLFPGTPILQQKVWFSLPIGVPILGSLVGQEVDVPFVPSVGMQPTQGTTVAPSVLGYSAVFDAVRETHDALEKLRQTTTIFTVLGTKGTYESMVVEDFTMKRDASTGTGAEFTIQMKELRQVSTQTVALPAPKTPRGAGSKSLGVQTTDETKNPAQVRSLLKALFGGDVTVPGL